MQWPVYALLSAIFAGLTAVSAKMGVSGVSSTLATFVRTIVVVLIAAAIVSVKGELSSLKTLTPRDWTALIFSGVATGLSWLFYFAALKQGPVSGVAPIDKLSFVVAVILGVVILREPIKPLGILGCILIVTGVLLTIPTVQDGLKGLFR